MNDVLQVPMTKEMREGATLTAIAQGYSSLQEMVRVFLKQAMDKKVETRFVTTAPPVKLSAKAEKRYMKLEKDIKSGKEKLYSFDSVDDLMDHLMK